MVISEVLAIRSRDLVIREVLLHQFIDQFRRSGPSQRRQSVMASDVVPDDWTVVVAAAIETVCMEHHDPVPAWTVMTSRHPVYIPEVPPSSPAASVLRRVSPRPFKSRNVFVPANYLARC